MSNAQLYQGEIVAQGGLGYGFLRTIYKVVNNVEAIGPYGGHIDVGIKPSLSVGGGFTYNEFDYDDQWTRDTFNLDVNVNARRMNFGARVLYHFPAFNPERTNVYGGLRLGFSVWEYRFAGGLEDERYEKKVPFKLNLPSFQAVVGYRYYFLPFMGIHVEVGVGTAPYFVMTGLSLKMNRQEN